MPAQVMIAQRANQVQHDAAETGFSEVDLHGREIWSRRLPRACAAPEWLRPRGREVGQVEAAKRKGGSRRRICAKSSQGFDETA